MSLKSPETGLIFGFALALSGGAILGQNRSILNVENEFVHWLIVVGVVLELCCMAFQFGLYLRRRKNSDEPWRQEIAKMIEKDPTIKNIQAKRMCKTIVLEEFTRPEPTEGSKIFSIFPVAEAATSPTSDYAPDEMIRILDDKTSVCKYKFLFGDNRKKINIFFL